MGMPKTSCSWLKSYASSNEVKSVVLSYQRMYPNRPCKSSSSSFAFEIRAPASLLRMNAHLDHKNRCESEIFFSILMLNISFHSG